MSLTKTEMRDLKALRILSGDTKIDTNPVRDWFRKIFRRRKLQEIKDSVRLAVQKPSVREAFMMYELCWNLDEVRNEMDSLQKRGYIRRMKNDG